ncbi:MAG: YeeE/YedE family protein [Alcanivoracaceae bacterium]|nr:YeeE/YedE family protein [Alcanivoracaceae bacterium]
MERHHFSALLTGLIFGAGLLLSGMANPEKVLGFLDVTGAWDPSLMMVMGGAIAVGIVGFAVVKGRSHSLFGEPISLPQRQDLDKRLIIGSLGFGIGWGLAGFCPGPALVAVGTGSIKAIVFVMAMIAGMAIFEILEKRKSA